MHDPKTVLWRIPNPLGQRWGKRWRDRSSLATVWHIDPEADGTDDSCGWFSPKLTKRQKSNLNHAAWCEAERPFYLRLHAKRNHYATDALNLMECAFGYVGTMIGCPVQPDEARRWALEAIRSDCDNFRHALCFVPGYHSNQEEDRKKDREYCAFGFFCSVASWILRERRPWWRRPRWHLHHWKIQMHWRRKAIQSECEAAK